MEESATSTTPANDWTDQFAPALARQRSRVQEFLAGQRRRLEKAQSELAGQVQRIGEELEQSRSQSAEAREEVRRRSEELTRRADSLSRLQKEFQSRQAEWDKAQHKATQYFNHLAGQVRREQDELARRRQELERRQAEVDAAAVRIHHDQQSFALERESHKLQAEHVAGLRQRLEANLAELESLRGQYERFGKQAASAPSAAKGQPSELESLRAERNRLAGRLNEAEQQLASLAARLADAEARLAGPKEAAIEGEAVDDLRRCYEMSLEDVRDLKARNRDLERQLAESRERSGAVGGAPGKTLDWEAEKSRILAALESECDPDDEQQQSQRVKIEQVIRDTDQIIAEKNREIHELRQLLENQSRSLGAVAVGAAALGDMFDKDAIILEERANLQRLQQTWEEKLRQAEIEISIERAKIARQRAEIEERLHVLELQSQQPEAPLPAPETPTRGRWLAMLGLSGSEKRQERGQKG